jgi:hypothetical protein
MPRISKIGQEGDIKNEEGKRHSSLFSIEVVADALSCSIPSSAAVVLLLGPFLGRGGAPARSLPRPRWCSCAVPSSASAVLGSSASPWCSSLAPRLRLGAPHETFGLASVLLLGSSALPWFSSSAPVLGPMTRCSARNLRPRVGSPPWLLGLALVLILGPIALMQIMLLTATRMMSEVVGCNPPTRAAFYTLLPSYTFLSPFH